MHGNSVFKIFGGKMKAIKWISGIVVVVVVISVAGIYGYLRSTLPDYDGEITVPGLAGEVKVIRDSYGMPHIYAKTDQDGFFALGYSMAQDRLFHMDIVRRAARGKLAEVLGKSLVPVDKLFRTITAAKTVEEIAAEYP
ncbi:MAG: penicillin acylase family protein, partial [Deltaproteobacteria bacterium]|nr:penicillin acylase family protein [Deltaproteobacteria bacterium]